MRTICLALGCLLAVAGCGRYFPDAFRPLPEEEQGPRMEVRDDGTVAYVYERLEISLRPLTDAELNRTFPAHSNKGAESTNPYTYGNWTVMGEDWTPQRFTVFLLRVKNYAYPKVRIDPRGIILTSQSRRRYEALDLLQMSEYYRAQALAWAGNYHARYREQEELLRRTLYKARMVFSGQEDEGYVAFPPMPPDVEEITLTVEDVAIRFNYADEPVEALTLEYTFEREVTRGYELPAAETATQ